MLFICFMLILYLSIRPYLFRESELSMLIKHTPLPTPYFTINLLLSCMCQSLILNQNTSVWENNLKILLIFYVNVCTHFCPWHVWEDLNVEPSWDLRLWKLSSLLLCYWIGISNLILEEAVVTSQLVVLLNHILIQNSLFIIYSSVFQV